MVFVVYSALICSLKVLFLFISVILARVVLSMTSSPF